LSDGREDFRINVLRFGSSVPMVWATIGVIMLLRFDNESSLNIGANSPANEIINNYINNSKKLLA